MNTVKGLDLGIKFDMTPVWWGAVDSTEPVWIVKAIRAVLRKWPKSEVRVTAEGLRVVCRFDPAATIATIQRQAHELRTEIDRVQSVLT